MHTRFVLMIATVFLAATAAFAAGEWEWTADQGWMRGAGVARPTPNEQLHYAYELEQRGEFMDAARQYFLLVQNFPDSQEAGVGLQRLARCLFEMENYYTSYRAIEQVIETYPNTGRMSDLVEIELRIAKRLMVSRTPDLLGGGGDPRTANIRRSLEIIDSVIEHDPYGPVAAEAYLVKGEGHLFLNEVNAARTAFEAIRDDFPRSDFVERARLGILTCDSLVGQASPAEVAEQANVVREMERDRAAGRSASGRLGLEDPEEMDSVEDSIRKLAEVEAAKMLDQAEQYRTMGTRQSVESSQFLYREVARRYPSTPQAQEALSRLDNVRVPANENPVMRVIKNINLNPFTYTKDPEPPWIVPQMSAQDQVMIDPGLGPIAGVPETGAGAPDPSRQSVGVRPANMPNQPPSAAGNFSPISAAPPFAPEFVDGTRERPPARNPLTTASESDLVLPPGSRVPPASQGGFGGRTAGGYGGYAPPPAPGYGGGAQGFSPAPGYPQSLGTAAGNAPYSDLVGAPRQGDFPRSAYGQTAGGYPQQGYAAQPQYAPQGYFPAPAQPEPQGGGGGWTLTDDFR